MFDYRYLDFDYRRPLRPTAGNNSSTCGACPTWEWIVSAGAILLFLVWQPLLLVTSRFNHLAGLLVQ